MNLIPFFDRSGVTKSWADPRIGWFYGLHRRAFGLVWFDGVFNKGGRQIACWRGDHILDLSGRVVLVRHGARIGGMSMPVEKGSPSQPRIHAPSAWPPLHRVTTVPSAKCQWADFTLVGGVEDRIRAFMGSTLPDQDSC
jgi:hypothetical protein